MESQKEFHCSCGRVFSSWSAKTMHLRDNRAHKDRDDLESSILAFSSLNLQETGKEWKEEQMAKKASRFARKAERVQNFKARAKLAEEQRIKNQENEMTDVSAPGPSTPTPADPTEKEKVKAEKQAITLERKKATAERRQKKNVLRAHKRSLQKMPSSAPMASSLSQAVSTVPPRRSPRFAEAESSSSAARRGRGRRSKMPETALAGSMQGTVEPMDVDMGETPMEKSLSVAEGKRPAFEESDVKGKGPA